MSTRGREPRHGRDHGDAIIGDTCYTSATSDALPPPPLSEGYPLPPASARNHSMQNPKTNPPPIPTFPQAPTTTRLNKTSHLPAFPNQREKAVSRHDQHGLLPDRNRTQRNLSALDSTELVEVRTQCALLASRGRNEGWFRGAFPLSYIVHLHQTQSLQSPLRPASP